LSGTLYDIDTSADKQVGAFTFQEAQILLQSNANCKGTNSCHGIMKPGTNIVEVNFYWANG